MTTLAMAQANTPTTVWDSYAEFKGVGLVRVSTVKLPAGRTWRGRFETAILWDERQTGGDGFIQYGATNNVDAAAQNHDLARDFALAEISRNVAERNSTHE